MWGTDDRSRHGEAPTVEGCNLWTAWRLSWQAAPASPPQAQRECKCDMSSGNCVTRRWRAPCATAEGLLLLYGNRIWRSTRPPRVVHPSRPSSHKLYCSCASGVRGHGEQVLQGFSAPRLPYSTHVTASETPARACQTLYCAGPPANTGYKAGLELTRDPILHL
jgi:hypothetical protein